MATALLVAAARFYDVRDNAHEANHRERYHYVRKYKERLGILIKLKRSLFFRTELSFVVPDRVVKGLHRDGKSRASLSINIDRRFFFFFF